MVLMFCYFYVKYVFELCVNSFLFYLIIFYYFIDIVSYVLSIEKNLLLKDYCIVMMIKREKKKLVMDMLEFRKFLMFFCFRK